MHVRQLVLPTLAAVSVACAPAGRDAPTGSTEQPLSSVPHVVSGKSTIEGRYVYAPPDEGSFEVPLTLDFSLPGELSVQEPSMIHGKYKVRFDYSKKKNRVDVTFTGKGLPYRPTLHKDFDDSTEFNKQWLSVTNGRWQLWLMGTVFGRHHETLYYDKTTLKFLGTRFDFAPLGPRPFPAEGTFITAPAPSIRMVCSPLFDPAPDGTVNFHYTLQYDHVADALGSPGVLNSVHPFDLCEPDHLENYWTNTRLPDDMFMSWDYFLQSIWNGEGIGVSTSVEPDPKPPELAYRDQTFIGPGNMYPQVVPQGFGMSFFTAANGPGGGSVIPIHGSTYQLKPWPSSTRHLCGGA